MPRKNYLGDFEQLVMLALIRLGDNAYGMTVRQEIEANADRQVTLGAVYATLDRLEEKGLISSFLGQSEAQRRGRAKRFFRVNASGVEALQRSLESLDRMRAGLDELAPAGVGT